MDAMDTALAHRAQATFALLGPAVFIEATKEGIDTKLLMASTA